MRPGRTRQNADSLDRFQDAMDGYNNIIASNYNDRSTANALTNRGRMKIMHGDTLGGLMDLRKSLSIIPTPPALMSLALLQSNRDSLLYYSQRVKAMAPDEPRAYYGLIGYYTLERPQKDSALHYANILLKLKPNKLTLDLLMTTYLTFQQPDELINVTTGLIRIDSTHAFAYNNRGFALHLKGDYARAERDIRHSLALNSTNSYAYRNLGLVFLKTQKPDSACVQFRKAKALGFAANYGDEVDALLKEHCLKK